MSVAIGLQAGLSVGPPCQSGVVAGTQWGRTAHRATTTVEVRDVSTSKKSVLTPPVSAHKPTETESRVNRALDARREAQKRRAGKARSFRKAVGNHQPH